MTSPRIFLSPPHMEGHEQEYVRQAFASNYIAPAGPMLQKFEETFCQYTGFSHCVALSSGTAALHLAMKYLGIAAGDTIIASTLTFIGSISSAIHLGANVVLIDCDRHTWNMDPALLREELAFCASIGCLPKAVIPTDLYGQSCDLDAILQICDSYNIPVVVDAAESVGAKYKQRHAGKGARAAAFSFNGNKIITCSGGGILASDDAKFIEYAKFLATQAREPEIFYQHNEVGYNYRLSNVCAAIGAAQLEVLSSRVAKKREIFEFYRQKLSDLPGISWMPEANYGETTRWLVVMLIDPDVFPASPEEIRLALEAENIESRPVWKPMHLQPALRHCRVKGRQVSEELFAKGLCLPSGTSMTEEDLSRIVSVIRRLRG